MRFSELDKIKNMVQHHVAVYYAEVRNQLAKYQSLSSAFPKYLTGYKRVHTTICKDGLIVAQYASEKDSFGFSISDRSTTEVFTRVSEVNFNIKFPPGAEFTLFNEFLYKWETTELGKQIASQVGVAPWEKVLRTSRIDAGRWSDKQARSDATRDVATFVTAHLMEIEKSHTDKLFEKLRSAIDAFKVLLDSAPLEERIQSFLTEHPVLLATTAARIVPKLQLGNDHTTDFMVELSSSEYLLVEIERANCKLFTKQGDPSKELKHAERQVSDWLVWVKDFTDYARNKMPGIIDPKCWVVIGRRASLSDKDLRRLKGMNSERHNITILTYDDLIDKAEQHLNSLQQFWNKQRGK